MSTATRLVATEGKGAFLRSVKKALPFYAILLPTFALIITFNYYPAGSAIFHSFFRWSVIEPTKFVGFQHFQTMAADPVLRTSIGNLLQLVAFRVFIAVVVPFIVAELMFSVRNKKVQYYYRIMVLLPMIVPGIVIMLIWRFIYNPHIGLANALLEGVGLGNLTNDWLGNPDTALYSLMFMRFPWVAGTGVLIYLAGLYSIPESLMDATKLDGVGRFRRIFVLDIHFVVGQIKLFIVLGFITGLQYFGEQLIMTQGGPVNRTMTPALHMYFEAFTYDRLGYASAIGFSMFVVLLILTYINLRFIKSKTEYVA